MKKLNLYFTRDFCLAVADLWHELVSVGLKKELGKDINEQIMYFNGRAIETYRPTAEMDELKQYIVNKSVDNVIFSKEKYDTFKKTTDQVLKLISKVENRDLNTKMDLFEVSVGLFRKMYPYIVLSNFLPSAWREEFIKNNPNGLDKIDRWYQARVFSEGKFEMIDAYWRKMTAELLQKHGYDKKYLRSLRLKELRDLIEGRLNIESNELEKRLKGYILHKGNLLTDKNLDEFFVENKYSYDLKIEENIQGQVACQGGLIQGTVQTVMNADEVANFKQNNILVTTMTVPEFLPAMKKAKAIITDEGGVTCHAAIVSREFNIPCIIGTKFATKILKDGDMVEVNTDKGLVKII